MNTKTFIKYIFVLWAACICAARHSPHRDYNINWLSLIEDPEHLQDARVFYTFFKDNLKKELEMKGKHGFKSGEADFEGFQHPFFYSQDLPELNIADIAARMGKPKNK